MGGGGVLIPPEGYFPKIQSILDKYDIHLIDDEVICGFGRTGNCWGYETFSMRPSSMTIAKALSSGYMPISAVIVSEEIFEPIKHASDDVGDKANPFATPLEILPEWYLYPVFQILRVVPNKLLGIALQTLIPLGLMILPFIENVNKFSNPFRRPIAMAVFLFGTFLTIYLGIGACLPIDKSLTLGLF